MMRSDTFLIFLDLLLVITVVRGKVVKNIHMKAFQEILSKGGSPASGARHRAEPKPAFGIFEPYSKLRVSSGLQGGALQP